MAAVIPHYEGDHRSQYDSGASARLRSMGCTPTSLANAIRCATGGKINLSGDQVLAKLPISEETNPLTPGWSLEDAAIAASRIAGCPPLAVRRAPWGDVTAALSAGYGVVLQGDSDQFLSGCSGTFDGDHCVFVHPDRYSDGQRLGDPICPDWRNESLTTLQRYAEKLSGLNVRFGVLQAPIPADYTPPDSSTDPEEPEMIPTKVDPTSGFVRTKAACQAINVASEKPQSIGPNETYQVTMTAELRDPGVRYFVCASSEDVDYAYLLAFSPADVTFWTNPGLPPVITTGTLEATVAPDGKSATVIIK